MSKIENLKLSRKLWLSNIINNSVQLISLYLLSWEERFYDYIFGPGFLDSQTHTIQIFY